MNIKARRRLLWSFATILFMLVCHHHFASQKPRSDPKRNSGHVQKRNKDGVKLAPTPRKTATITSTPEHEKDGPKCLLPSIEPDPANYPPKDFKPFSCSHNFGINPVRLLEGGLLYASVPNSICSYANVPLINDFKVKVDEALQQWPKNVTTIPCPSDVVHVVCSDEASGKKTFEIVIRCMAKKPSVTGRIEKPLQAENKQPGRFQERLNILTFGLDSVARVTWLEQMHRTNEFVNELGAITFEGYNIVGDGTTAAVLAIMTGYLEDELHEARRGFAGAEPIDDFPFLCKQLRDEAGYVTLLDEDHPNIGTFQYRLLGFKNPPVDYYGRHYQLALGDRTIGKPGEECIGAMSTFEEMLRTFRHLFAIYPDPVRKYAFVINEVYTHTGMGTGTQTGYRVDGILADELKFLHKAGHLNQSVLILFADHGSRLGNSRATQRGKIAERLPYLTFVFPPWFHAKYQHEMEQFRAATKQLTTPFDLHATLLDIGGVKPVPGTPQRGLSFFEPLPPRTCEEAGILPHWCLCLDRSGESALPLDDPLVSRSLDEFQQYVNGQLLVNHVNDCEQIRALRAFSAQRLALGSQVAHFVKSDDIHGRQPKFDAGQQIADRYDYLQISFWSEPGNGQWEVTFLHKIAKDEIEVLPKQISRTNKYGSAPACIQDAFPHLRQFCYCKAQNSPK